MDRITESINRIKTKQEEGDVNDGIKPYEYDEVVYDPMKAFEPLKSRGKECLIENIEPERRRKGAEYWLNLWTNDKAIHSLILFGGSGYGKTYFVKASLNRWRQMFPELKKGCSHKFKRNFIYYNTNDLLKKLRPSRTKDSDDIAKIVDYICSVDLLALDDLGSEPLERDGTSKEWFLSELYNIFDYRCEFKLPNILTSNLTLDGLKSRYGDRIYSRMRSGAKVVNFGGKDRRIEE